MGLQQVAMQIMFIWLKVALMVEISGSTKTKVSGNVHPFVTTRPPAKALNMVLRMGVEVGMCQETVSPSTQVIPETVMGDITTWIFTSKLSQQTLQQLIQQMLRP